MTQEEAWSVVNALTDDEINAICELERILGTHIFVGIWPGIQQARKARRIG